VSIRLTGVLPIKYDQRVTLERENLELYSSHAFYGPRLFQTPIPINVTVSYAHDACESIFMYDDRSTAAQAYMRFVHELVERVLSSAKAD
jgi:cellulose biosynthesis protein BcsQ